MGILDDAIRDHLDLKRRRGTDEPELKRLEDEAFGPPGRPDASGAADSAIASALATPSAETAVGTESELEPGRSAPKPNGDVATRQPSAETPAPEAPAPEAPPAPEPETAGDEDAGEVPESSGEIVFHDFAAEEGLVDVGSTEPTVEDAPSEEPRSEVPAAEAPAEDTQVHDMEKELGLADERESEQAAGEAGAELESDAATGETLESPELEELDIELEDEELELPPEELDSDELDVIETEPGDDAEEGEDVLEETPEFLRDAPESDRLWFEQGKPKDFDFDEDE